MISGQFPPRVSSGVRPCRVHTASMIDTLSENCFSSGFKFMSHSGVIMPHVKVDQAISLHTTPSFFSPSTGEGEYLPFFFPFLIISLPNGKRRSSIRRFPFLARRSGAICIPVCAQDDGQGSGTDRRGKPRTESGECGGGEGLTRRKRVTPDSDCFQKTGRKGALPQHENLSRQKKNRLL